MRRLGFIFIILLTSFWTSGQIIIEVSLTDLATINADFGLDSLKNVVRRIPIWTLDTATSISILKTLNPTKDRYSWENFFITELGSAVKSQAIDLKLKQLLSVEIENIQEADISKEVFQSPVDKVLTGLLFQGSNDLEAILEGHLIKLESIGKKIDQAQPKSKLKYFFKGSPPVVWNKYELNLTKFKLLSCLNRLNPEKYPDKLLDEKRKGLHAIKKDYSLKETRKANCYDYREVKPEETEINGIKVPKELFPTKDLSDKCWLFKIKKDENNYIIEKGCSFGPLAGHGETLKISRENGKFKICLLEAWIS